MSFLFSGTSRQRLIGVNSKMVSVMERALTVTRVDFGIPELGGVRTAAEQLGLWMDGKTHLDGKAQRSKHQDGLAVDVFAYVDGKATWDEKHMLEVAVAVYQAAADIGVQVRWGGHWRSPRDMPHFHMVI